MIAHTISVWRSSNQCAAFHDAKERIDNSSRDEYGDYYSDIFNRNSSNKATFLINQIFLHASLVIKFLIGQFQMQKRQEESIKWGRRRILLKLELTVDSSSSSVQDGKGEAKSQTSEMPTFTWMSAGHSSAAGHGNLHHQAYTQVMADAVQDLFGSLGVRFVGHNCGMSGVGSAPKLAMCMESIYGPDTDVLSWDFGLTDGKLLYRLHLWCA